MGVEIEGNGWKSLHIVSKTITTNTILEFEFQSESEGEIHGIGLDNDDNYLNSEDQLFQLFGSQSNFGNQVFNDYQTSDGWKTYSINVGNYFTGDIDRITFVNDDDTTNPTNISQFRNISLFESMRRLTVASSESQANSTNINQISGTKGADTLIGTLGDDRLFGDQGDDELTGSGSKDIFIIGEKDGLDTITDFTLGKDQIGLSGNLNYGSISLINSHSNTIISHEGNDLAVLNGVNSSLLESIHFTNV